MRYRLLLIKRFIEDIFIYPFILLGRRKAAKNPLKEEYDIFFLFPFYHIGGAEKVHAQIAQAFTHKKAIIFFTRKSLNDFFFEEFTATGHKLVDISKHTDNKWQYYNNLIYRGILSYYINTQKRKPVVFNGQCNMGYKLSPWIKKDIAQIELIHSLCSFSYIRIPFLPFITETVMISKVRIQEHIELYKRYGIPLRYAQRIHFILNGIKLPEPRRTGKLFDKKELTVLYVGRDTPEKRVHLMAELAKQCTDENMPVRFQFLGSVANAIPAELHQYAHFWGNQSDTKVIDDIYENADILILLSDTEGFPMVIMEAMARGLIILTTSVGEIPLHVKSFENGFVIEEFKDSTVVQKQAFEHIKYLELHRNEMQKMSESNINYAYQHYDIRMFNKSYQALVEATANKMNQ